MKRNNNIRINNNKEDERNCYFTKCDLITSSSSTDPIIQEENGILKNNILKSESVIQNYYKDRNFVPLENGFKEVFEMSNTYGPRHRYNEKETRQGGINDVYYPEQVIVMNNGRNGTATNSLIARNYEDKNNELCNCIGKNNQSNAESSYWCKPLIIMFLLITLLVFSVFVSVIILWYFNNGDSAERQTRIEDACERASCTHGATCINDQEGKAMCKCPAECPESENPVCGTDNVTYKNLCSLRFTACQNKLNIRVQHPGDCYVLDPCRGIVCQSGARCIPSEDGQTATCDCPITCPNYGDHHESRPVCGTDARDYQNQCHMKKMSCAANTTINVKYEGFCDPCSTMQCSSTEICQLDPQRNAVCRCSENCPTDITPVCASDGKTYSNDCEMRQQACRYKRNLRVVYEGKCGSGNNPCASVNCKSNEVCIINKLGIAACECQSDCEPILKPVCGTDGITYDSECYLKQHSCRIKRNITTAFNGICGHKDLCENNKCEYGAHCVQRNGTAVCECPVCSHEFEPVCASDGISYGNRCKLTLESCRRRKYIILLYDGLCNGCENQKCQYYSKCEIDEAGESKCVCTTHCPNENKPVCGSDGKTYNNKCELMKISCESKELITVSYEGNCDACENIRCKYGAKCEAGSCVCPSDCGKDLSVPVMDEPVCASDMNTYSNECEMQRHACLKSIQSLKVLFYGDCKERINIPVTGDNTDLTGKRLPNNSADAKEACSDIHCEYDATCTVGPDNFPECSCVFNCPIENTKSVCGSDFQIYTSICHMKMNSCQKKEEIRLRPIDLCKGMEVKPCGGRSAIVDPETGNDYDCGSGLNRKDCPSDSYCHHTSKFAKCCSKETGLYLTNCKDSWYGCCPDNKAPAQGPDNAGCPSLCGCNKLGSYSDSCEPSTGQCKCKPGVGGNKCDRCQPGFWGLPKISSGHPGCLPCGCSLFGSVRDDCEQMTGRCVCKPGVQGPKCTSCADVTKVLGPNGCIYVDSTTPIPRSCDELNCYFGATCEVKNSIASCICHISCAEDNAYTQVVCGNDGQTYSSECQLKLFSCRYQKDIAVQALSSCTDDYLIGTETAFKLTALTSVSQFADVDESTLTIAKSTRHLPIPDHQNPLYNKINEDPNDEIVLAYPQEIKVDFYNSMDKPTTATIKALIGNLCKKDSECFVLNSYCRDDSCVCRSGYVESNDKQSCIKSTPALGNYVCQTNTCKNGGLCKELENENFECICKKNYKGATCELHEQQEVKIAGFNGQSYVKLKELKAYHKFSIEIEFKTHISNAILLYSQQRDDGTGDFISLALVNGFVEFRYNLGNGPAILRSIQQVTGNHYHKIVAKRYQRDGILQVDNYESITGQSEGTLRALDLNENAFVGFVPKASPKIFENIGTHVGLTGCIRKLKIGRHLLDLSGKSDMMISNLSEIHECEHLKQCNDLDGDCGFDVNSCSSNSCHNGSTCQPLLQGRHVCICLPGYRGDLCDIYDPKSEDLYIAEFDGRTSYLEFPCLEDSKRLFSIEIWFLVKKENGMLFYNGQLKGRKGDFISLNLINGHVQFRYDLGSGFAVITTDNKVNLNKWNIIRVDRFDRYGTIQLNNGSIARGLSGPSLTELNLELPLYVGGVPSLMEVNRDCGIVDLYEGAIQRIIVNGKSLSLSSAFNEGVFAYKDHECNTNGLCEYNHICLPHLESHLCKCPPGYDEQCQYIDNDLAVKFTGSTYLQYKTSSKQLLHFDFINTNNSMVLDGYSSVNDYEYDKITNYDDYDYYNNNDDDNIATYDNNEAINYDFFYKQKKMKKFIQYEFSIRTMQGNGLILWSSRIRQSDRDYLVIAISNGYVEFIISFGKEKTKFSITSKELITDGKWHNVWIQHRKKMTQLRIDRNQIQKVIRKEDVQKWFLINDKIFIGGIPNITYNVPMKYHENYNGCLKGLVISRKKIDLTQVASSQHQIEFCN